MRIALLIAITAGLAAGCSGERTAEAPDTQQAAPALKGRAAVYQAARETPEAFVRALYAQYAPPGAGEAPPPPGQDPIYDRMLNAMIRADFEKAAGEAPSLNYDPICGCQDGGAFTLDSVAITPGADPRSAEAAVIFTNAGETTRQTLKLVKEGGNWKVNDVLVPGEKPLTEQLMAAIS
jgi:hypothetical protein